MASILKMNKASPMNNLMRKLVKRKGKDNAQTSSILLLKRIQQGFNNFVHKLTIKKTKKPIMNLLERRISKMVKEKKRILRTWRHLDLENTQMRNGEEKVHRRKYKSLIK